MRNDVFDARLPTIYFPSKSALELLVLSLSSHVPNGTTVGRSFWRDISNRSHSQRVHRCTCHILDNTIALTVTGKHMSRRTKMVTATGMLFSLSLAIFSNI